MRRAIGRILMVVTAALVGYGFGWVGGSLGHVQPKQENYPFLAERFPLPHHVPEHPGGLSFRFAMAHDVLFERFPRHGPAHYQERDRLVRAERAKLRAGDPAWFTLGDDLAAGLERLGRSDEAVEVIRDKLARQIEDVMDGRDLYTSFANLGTFLIHGSFAASMAGDADARARFVEGVVFIRRSVEVNPQAHFGRERWQAAIAEFLLAAMDKPVLLRTFDCLGNRLDLEIGPILDREANWVENGYGRAYDPAFSQGKVFAELPDFFRPGEPLDDPSSWQRLAPIRRHVTKVGAETGWEEVAVPSHRVPVPFDEPMLGMIGMWRQGGGANPHFALAMGETMLRVGQRYIAWDAFERASALAGRFWPIEAARQALRDHCRKRQGEIEESLRATSRESGRSSTGPAPAEVSTLRPQFNAELAYGQDYQRAYQDFEAGKIEGGVPIDDPHFFDEFHTSKGPIASPTGPEEWFVGAPKDKIAAYAKGRARSWGVFCAGMAAMLAALLIRFRSRPGR